MVFFNNDAIIEECDRLLEKGDIKPISQIDREYIMFRKRFGPPGTGKTYYAEKAAQELAARNIFGKSWETLSGDERKSILGDG